MASPFFSVVFPTRNRYETLQYSIKTILNQEFSSFEIIIADNSDEEALPLISLIDGYLIDKRIRYHRPSEILSMSDNWDFAVSKASGDFIIVLGDDDGLVAGSMQSIYQIIQKTNVEVVSWARVEYYWPDVLPKNHSNLLIVPYKARTGTINGKSYIKNVLRNKADYRYLPMLYNSAVSKHMVKLLIEKTNRIFNATSPDIYSGYAFAHLAKDYISVGYPLSINGISSKSNGAAHMVANGNTEVIADFSQLKKKSKVQWPAILPDYYSSYLCTVEPFIQLSNFFPEIKKYITRSKIFKLVINELEGSNQEEFNFKVGQIKQRVGNDIQLNRLLTKMTKKNSKFNESNLVDHTKEGINFGFDGSYWVADGSKFGLQNVYDVSLFTKNLFGEFKESDFLTPVAMPFWKRIRRAAAIIIRGGQ